MDTVKIPLTGTRGIGKYTIVDGDYDGEYFSQFKWHIDQNGYASRKTTGLENCGGNKTSYLHHEVCFANKGMIRDHINGNKLDNRSCNLRVIDAKQSAQNRAKRKTSKNPYIGVYKCTPRNKKWSVRCNKKYYYSKWDSASDAAMEYDRLVREAYGKYARLNFPIDTSTMLE